MQNDDEIYLAEIAKIIKKFAKKEDLLEYCTLIMGNVDPKEVNSSAYIHVDNDNHWNHLTKRQIREKCEKLHKDIKAYMIKSSIEDELVIEGAFNRSGNDGCNIFFIRKMHVSL